MFADFLCGSTGCYFLSQLNDGVAIIKVTRNFVGLCCNRIVATIIRQFVRYHIYRLISQFSGPNFLT